MYRERRFLGCMAHSCIPQRLWRRWHAKGVPDRLLLRNGSHVGVCTGLAASEVGQHLAHRAGSRNTQFCDPVILRSHHCEAHMDAIPDRRVWLRNARGAIADGMVLHARSAIFVENGLS